jgi:hypothetical protein
MPDVNSPPSTYHQASQQAQPSTALSPTQADDQAQDVVLVNTTPGTSAADFASRAEAAEIHLERITYNARQIIDSIRQSELVMDDKDPTTYRGLADLQAARDLLANMEDVGAEIFLSNSERDEETDRQLFSRFTKSYHSARSETCDVAERSPARIYNALARSWVFRLDTVEATHFRHERDYLGVPRHVYCLLRIEQ